MNREQFRAALRGLGLTITRFAELTGYSVSQISTWGGSHHGREQPVPAWAALLLAAWRDNPASLQQPELD